MALRLHNTLTRSVEPFEPLDPPIVRIYGCGPTIYAYPHIGNYRSFLVYDLVHRYLDWRGYDVRFVVNLTDVDDKTIEGAAASGVSLREFTEPFGRAFLEDAETLGVRPFDAYPRATEYIGPMIGWIRKLEERGLAYAADDGSVYFQISAFPGYGRLRGLDPDQLRVGARVAVDEYDKEDARDFVLWKAARAVDEQVGAAWDSPWGRGRPGWHLECSVMSIRELGETLDLHLGGEDLVFPHHENEIAQSEGVTGKPFVRYWLHVKHLMLEGDKMSKSAGNYITVRELLDEGVEPAAIRHQLVSAHYRSELNFTRDGLEASRQAVQRLLDFEARLRERAGAARPAEGRATEAAAAARLADAPGPLAALAREALTAFRDAMDDDLNTAQALAAVFVFVNRANAALDRADAPSDPADAAVALDVLRSLDAVLGLLEVAARTRSVDPETAAWIERMVAERAQARAERDFARADAIRDELAERGVILEDSPQGTRWKVVAPV